MENRFADLHISRPTTNMPELTNDPTTELKRKKIRTSGSSISSSDETAEPNASDLDVFSGSSRFKQRHKLLEEIRGSASGESQRSSSTEAVDDEYMVKMHEQVVRLTKEQRVHIQETFHTYLDTNVIKNGVAIMLKLFSDYPHYKCIWPQFRAIPDSSLMNAEALRKHAVIYVGGLRFIISSMDEDERLNKALRRIAHAHVKRCIYKSHIMHMLPPLLEVLDENSGHKLDKEVREAWTTLFDVIANLIDIFRVAESKNVLHHS